MVDSIDPTVASERRAALKREMRDTVVVHAALYLGMIFMPAFALIWARNQADRYLWVSLGAASLGLLAVPVSARWRWIALAALIAIAFAIRFTVLR